LGNGDGTFQGAVSYPASGYTLSVAIGDFNGDGRPDLAVGFGTGIDILLGNGDGSFQAPAPQLLGTPGCIFVSTGDFDSDGKTDLAVANTYKEVSIFLGNGNGTFQGARNYSVGNTPQSVAIGDFNGDGKPDLAIVDGSTPIRLLTGISTISIGLTHSGSFAAGGS
jgi:hypothetical protein